MVSAQCVIKNVGNYCEMGKRKFGDSSMEHRDGSEKFELVDRFQKSFFVRNHCKFCYNTIYNGDCIALSQNADEILEMNPRAIRLDFTFESDAEIEKIMSLYISAFLLQNPVLEDGIEGKNLTRGHFKRGIL